MKKLFLLLLLSVLTLGMRAMSFEEAQRHALFLSDKMAYELQLTPRQYEEVYQINFDYLLFVEPGSVYGNWWRSRNAELRRILTSVQYAEYERTYHFYRPVHWRDGAWHYGVYGYYTDRTVFYRERPRIYGTYRGGRYFGPRPAGPRPGASPRPAPRPGAGPRPGDGPRPNGLRDRGPAPRANGLREGPAPRGALPNGTRPNAAPRQNTPAPRANGLRQSPSQRPNNARPGNTPQRSNNLRQGNTPQRSNNLRQGTTTQRPSSARPNTTNRSNTRGTTDRARREVRR
jgi:hypothetical protein